MTAGRDLLLSLALVAAVVWAVLMADGVIEARALGACTERSGADVCEVEFLQEEYHDE